jgi:glycosyltransferase involved in cell wall biosynthesis
MSGRALLLAPSRGHGGGIERYASALEWALRTRDVDCERLDLAGAGARAQARLLAQARRALRAQAGPARLILCHRSLLPAGTLLAREPAVGGISVVCHGSDVWGRRPRARGWLERRLMVSPAVRVVAASSFTAGALASGCHASVLPPGLSRDWFDVLVRESEEVRARPPGPGFRLVTAFRLSQWRGKGLAELLGALAALGRPDVRLAVCGSGQPSAELANLAGQYPFCCLRPSVTDRELAGQLAAADLFVLATRTRGGRDASGEGFGLVLLEAQVAGTPVVAPAFGGSHDAFVDGVTGVAPADESAQALAKVLDSLLGDRPRLAAMGVRAGAWARERFDPDRYASVAVARLM